MDATRLWFIRHGEVQADLVGAFIGTTEAHLSDLGRHQAEAIAAYLGPAPLDAILVSPRRRALDTAAPLARAREMRLDVRSEFSEMHYGRWEGLKWPDIATRFPQESAQWQGDPGNVACPGGESVSSFAERVHQGLDGVLEEFANRNVAIVGHSGVNRAILAHVLGRTTMECFVFAQDYGCVNAAAWSAQGPQVALVNFVPGPASEDDGD